MSHRGFDIGRDRRMSFQRRLINFEKADSSCFHLVIHFPYVTMRDLIGPSEIIQNFKTNES